MSLGRSCLCYGPFGFHTADSPPSEEVQPSQQAMTYSERAMRALE